MNYKLILKILLSYIKTILVILFIWYIYISIISWKEIPFLINNIFTPQNEMSWEFVDKWILIGNIISYFLIIIFIFLMYKWYIKGTKNLPYKLKKIQLRKKDVFTISFLFLSATSLSYVICWFGKVSDNGSLSSIFTFIKIIIIMPIVLAPVLEEIVFRGMLFNICLNKKFVTIENEKITTILTIVFATLFFAFSHSLKFDLIFITHIPTAFVYTYVYYKYKNIKINMFLHFLHNLIDSILVIIFNWAWITSVIHFKI